MRFLKWLIFAVLSLRYRFEIVGEDLKNLKEGRGILFLPNHASGIDPFIHLSLLYPRFRMRPVSVEFNFRVPFLRFLLKRVRTLAIPNFDTSVNGLKIKRANDTLSQIIQGLKAGDNFFIYPSGRIKLTGKEIIGGASGTHTILEQCPEAQVVLIRTTGFWGSRFSHAGKGDPADVMWGIKQGIGVILKNLIFFAPRRKIRIEIECVENIPRSSRMECNAFLENWYNRYPEEIEPLQIVPDYFWQKKREGDGSEQEEKAEQAPVSEETRSLVYQSISKILGKENLSISPEMKLGADLGMDSLNIAELAAAISQQKPISHSISLDTVQDLLEAVEEGIVEQKSLPVSRFTWPRERPRPPLKISSAKTIPEVFLEICSRMGSFSACGDDRIGPISYRKMKRVALVLSERFKRFPEKNIGILLPASAGAYIVIFALHLAGKVPVMLNWTLGPRYLDQMVQQGGVETILSSWYFFERISNVEFGNSVDKIQYLEEMRETITWKEKGKALFGRNEILCQEEDPAVILFTSGTEAAPKGVVLTHKNLLSNMRSVMEGFPFSPEDVAFSFLPPFHSFGFSIMGVFSILSCLRTTFYADPTNYPALAEGIERWKATHVAAPPTFIKGLLKAASPGQLSSLKILFSGSEKMPAEIPQLVQEICPNVKLVEGYGITECSPAVAMGHPRRVQVGVGRAIPGVELATIHPETSEWLAKGTEGEICVSGPNVFGGYLGEASDPFIWQDGKKWYRTGDLGYLDKEGNLIISGRLKRFVKVGGEMVSLGALEEALSKEYNTECIICPRGEPPTLVLFAKIPIDLSGANDALRKVGFSNLMKISEVKTIPEFPLMASGKVDYRTLSEKATD